jgi:UDP-N-acetylmuramoyl-tripeptide--D-alanyl-D-alanine ligase
VATPIPGNSAPLTVWSAAAATGGRVVRADEGDIVARGVGTDSRTARPGSAFVALRGDRTDGHAYVDAAVRKGACLVVVEEGATVTADTVDVLAVPDTLVAWGDLARAHVRAWRRDRRDARLFAITGSAGKTTTKELCAALLRSLDKCHSTTGNLNNRIGVPAVAFGLEPRHRFAVFEVGMSVRGEIAHLASVLEPDVALMTNVGVAHAAGVGGTRADVAREKGDLFASLARDSVAVVCFDDAAAMGQLARSPARRAVTFGIRDGADYRLLGRTAAGIHGAHARILRRRDASELYVRVPVIGEAAALDLVGALAAVESVTGPFDSSAITAALRLLRAPAGRMQARVLKNGTMILDDTYNANPQSVRAALRTLGELTQQVSGRRAVVVLGEMRELGDGAEAEHAALGAALVGSGARLVLSCGGLADLAAVTAARAGVAAVRAADVVEAAQLAVQHVAPGDVVLVKASRSVGAERVVDSLVNAGGGEVEPAEGD